MVTWTRCGVGLAAVMCHTNVPPRACPTACAPVSSNLDELLETLPFLSSSQLAERVTYTGLGRYLVGREAVASAASRWRSTLPTRLEGFAVEGKTILPPDSRGVVSCRYKLSFTAPVPPAVLPGQRRRLDAAKLTYTADGRTRVTAIVAAQLQLDQAGRVSRHTETLLADPFAVTTSIAHFELLNARAIALAATPPIVREPLAYWDALRAMMRIELEESVRRSRTDELAVLEGADASVSDEEFEAQFRLYIARIFLLGAAGPAVVFAIARLLREGLL